MTIDSFRSRITIGFVSGYLLTILTVFSIYFFWPINYVVAFSERELKEVVPLLLPVFSATISAIVVYYRRHSRARSSPSGEKVDAAYAFITIAICLVVFLVLLASVFLKAYGKLSFDGLKIIIDVTQVALGAYIVQLVGPIFK
jgi:hypothetical protein